MSFQIAIPGFNFRCIPVFLILFSFSFLPAFSEPGAGTECGALPLEIAYSEDLKFSGMTEEIGVDLAHVQGLFVNDKFFFATSVDKPAAAAWIWKIDRATLEVTGKKNLAKNFDIHPGGIDFDGRNIWVGVAVYTEYSHAYMMMVDPETLRHRIAFEVKDHIGAVAVYGDLIIGANWNARDFYFWTKKGEILEKRASPTGIGYQDCKGQGNFLMCVGGGYLDWIDVESWQLCRRFPLGKSLTGESLSREGAARLGNSVFFLPDDGPTARIYEYRLDKSETGPAIPETGDGNK